jgi:hypothetical protein
MSGYSQTTDELLYAFYGAATTTTITVTPQTLIATYPEIIIPGGFMQVVGKRSSSLRLKMGGIFTATATIPTFTVGLEVTPSGGNILVTSGTFTPAASTNQPWALEVEIGLRTLSVAAASTVGAMGELRASTLTAAANTGAVPLPAPGAYAPNTAWESDLQYFLWPYLTLGTATAGNTMTTEYVKLYGEN